MHLVQVDALGPQPAQRCFHLPPQAGRVAAVPRIGAGVSGIPDQAAFGEHEGPVGVAVGLQRAGHHLLGMPESVHRGGVDPVHSGLDRVADRRHRRVVVLLTPAVRPAATADRPGAEADPG